MLQTRALRRRILWQRRAPRAAAIRAWALRSDGARAAAGTASTADLGQAFKQVAAATPALSQAALTVACREVVAAHDALGPRASAQWWAQQALAEEQQQMEKLGRALPRGGVRLAPQLLEQLSPTEPSPSEMVLRHVVASLGVSGGLFEAIRLRAAVRAAAILTGPRTSAGFALQRMDRRLQQLLLIWFSPGLLEVEVVDGGAVQEVREITDVVAHAIVPATFQGGMHHRCFALRHPLMRQDAAADAASILLCAHASLLPVVPASLAEVVAATTEASPANVACFWSLGFVSPGEGLRGLGLGRELLRCASERLRAEMSDSEGSAVRDSSNVVVCALAPLRGFAAWLRQRRAWESVSAMNPDLGAALRRALEGLAGGGSKEVRFVDTDGDSVCFKFSPSTGLEVALGDAAPNAVLRIRVAAETRTVLFLTDAPEAQALQVQAPEDTAELGDFVAIAEMAEASGILPMELRAPLLPLAQEFLSRRTGDGKRLVDPMAHFHASAGASVGAVLWRADESFGGRAESLGVMVRFDYDLEAETERAAAYAENGLVAFGGSEAF